MESQNITSITDDAHLELSDSSFSNKVFAKNFDKSNGIRIIHLSLKFKKRLIKYSNINV